MPWTDLRILVVDTARVWWRLLPPVLTAYLLGWLAAELTLRLAVLAGDLSPWLALVLFAFSFVWVLVASVVILRLVGLELGIRALLREDERSTEHRDDGLGDLLLVTLLPFLGMYAAFGQVAEAANRLLVQQSVRYGVLTDQVTVTGLLRRFGDDHLLGLVGLLAGVYVLRRVVDRIRELTGWRVAGLLTVLIEAFFLLVLVLGGVRVFQRLAIWLQERAVAQWLGRLEDAAARVFAVFRIDLPAVVDRVAAFVADQVWPMVTDVISQPLLWLAVAALVYGSRVLSLADLWRQGVGRLDRVPVVGTFARYRDKQAARRIGPPPQGVQLAVSQVRQVFLGDIDDKYLPALHSLRLVLRAGAGFLGAYVLVYTVVLIGQNYTRRLLHTLTGGHGVTFWVRYEPLLDVIQLAPWETLRLCLLAVAFRRCLELFRLRSVDAEQTVDPAARPVVTA